MGFSTPTPEASPDQKGAQGAPSNAAQGPSFGDSLMSYMQNRLPVTSAAVGAAGDVFGGGEQNNQQAVPMQYGNLIEMNAKPKSGGAAEMLLKLITGGA